MIIQAAGTLRTLLQVFSTPNEDAAGDRMRSVVSSIARGMPSLECVSPSIDSAEDDADVVG